MDIYLIRHAVAEDKHLGKPDARRALTSKGRKQFRRVVRCLDRMDICFDLVLHSPWLRAVQTADMLMPLLDGESRVTELLARTPTPKLLELVEGKCVALVGHEPWVSELLALLLFGDRKRANAFSIRKGAVIRLSGEATLAGAVLEGLWDPGVMK